MTRAAAITHARTGASKLWAGTVTIHPHAKRVRTTMETWRVSFMWCMAVPACVGAIIWSTSPRLGQGFYLCAAIRPASGNQRQPE